MPDIAHQRPHHGGLAPLRSFLKLSDTGLVFATSLYLAASQNDALWRFASTHVDGLGSPTGLLLVATLAAILLAGTFTVAAALSLGPALRIGLIAMTLIAVVCNHFMHRYGAIIDQEMWVNVIRTDAREAAELITRPLIWQVVVFGGTAVIVIALVPVTQRPLKQQLLQRGGIALLLWALAAVLLGSNYKEASLWARAHSQVRELPNPVFPMVSAYKLARDRLITSASAAEFRELAVRVEPRAPSGRRRVVVMVVGETARADHFSLYGYPRDTNPALSAIPTLLRFRDVSACGTSTAVSVPCMFARQDRSEFDSDEARRTENLLDVLQRADVHVQWLDNNTGCQGVCDRVAYAHTSPADTPALCDDRACFDEALLHDLSRRMTDAEGDQLIVLHQLGSHGPSYHRRYPRAYARFTPECTTDDAYRCPREMLINSYDNTIVYTDHVLARLIQLLAAASTDADTAMLYVSDHGESLGENGIYLHGLPYALAPAAQTQVPMLMWLSPAFIASRALSVECLEQQTQRRLSHDNVFDIVLGLFAVDTELYRPQADVIGACGASA
ncbi:phosphoethanolamine transferase [Sinimarinibacterium thermocellulolyticum]|uniref:Phosphoethanolamine--lipid A transferase n=1 Tax=Sinimarinibacterium thermocellulolyticum TaxID=3170016 RepID=A0ABV2A5W0_9GAMM